MPNLQVDYLEVENGRGGSRNEVSKINIGEPDEMGIGGFCMCTPRLIATIILIILTGGLALVFITWRKDIKMFCLYTAVPLSRARKILLTDNFEQVFEEDVIWVGERPSYFVNKKIKYVWSETGETFQKLKTIQIIEMYGDNLIKISVPPILYLVIHEGLNPFYLFQVYTVVLWSLQYYWKFAVIIAVTSVVSVTVSVWETRRQNRNLRDTMKSESKVRVVRDNKEIVLSSVDLVPGDTILLPATGGYTIECDSVLVEGSAVVNESMLTGESIPVTKVGIPDEREVFNYDYNRQYIMFCGTEVMQGKAKQGNYIKAVVIRTGFMTTKGELVRAILFPPPLDFKFFSDFLKSVYVFLTLGLIGMGYSMAMWIRNGGTISEILLNSLDILTFVVPPILPAALTANNAFAQRRLQKRGIFCLHTKHISLCGGIDVVAFDKTGTLTEGDLDLAGVCEIKENQFQESEPNPSRLPTDSLLIQTMASCHSLIKMNGELTGYPMDIKLFEAIGWELKEEPHAGLNPEYGIATPTLVSPPKNIRSGGQLKLGGFAPSNLEIALLKQYPFDSAVQRMTVVAKKKGSSNYSVFIKGAPEKVASLCKPETIPQGFTNLLQYYTKQGFRVIGAAVNGLKPGLKLSEVNGLSRSELEMGADFLGLIIMQNLVKKETYGAIKELHDADIHTVMVTGDNILTAISVGRDCELVKPDQTIVRVTLAGTDQFQVQYTAPETETASIIHDTTQLKSLTGDSYVFACDGPTFNAIMTKDPELFKKIVHRGKIFARMLPEQKIHLIEALKNMGRQVIMCGDGCNDCGALKTAHAGISLSMAEASVAAPFTSRNVNISCVPYLIREGRATMVSAFASFKFGVAFCFTQLISVLMVFYIGTEPSDNQYLVVDIGLAAVPILMIGNTAPHDQLVKRKPTRHLLSFLPMFSVVSFLFFQTIAYMFIWFYVQSQEWFVKYQFVSDLWPPNSSYEQTNIFLYACAAATIAAIIFSKGSPYRKPLYTNGIMATWTLAAVSTVIFMSLYRTEDFAERLNFKIAPHFEFQVIAVIGIFVNFCFCYLWEIYVLDGFLFQKVLPWYKDNVRGPNLEFEHLEKKLASNPSWPPIGEISTNKEKGSTEKYPGYPLPDVAASINSKSQFSVEPVSTHTSRKDKFLKNPTKNMRRRDSDGSKLLSETCENPESTPVHITKNQISENLPIHTAIEEMAKQHESNLLSDPLNLSGDRLETAC
ncbi:probable cation-transporting ATPase 13A3 [Eurytemora carolleeae]|uniref:probable cation-transporting ATPase 13A3 n=1 Tax=Eurytemora carolleeae TaxID=1294199 RepID=UPI000C77C680|nr:probable cation-transporting ATPase 13A3 [Eurytemora carolleeae]|eukprot:XP_023320447.1 probable cation-transporting ATPase 13A3 [Eurytemora affinis]